MVGTTLDWEGELRRWLKPFLNCLGYKARRRSGAVGASGRSCRASWPTKPEMASVEVDRMVAAGVRFGCVLADAGYGLSAPFRHGLTARGLAWAVGIPRHLKVYPVDVQLIWPAAARGRPRQQRWRTGTRIRDKGEQHLPGDEAWLIWRTPGVERRNTISPPIPGGAGFNGSHVCPAKAGSCSYTTSSQRRGRTSPGSWRSANSSTLANTSASPSQGRTRSKI